MKKSEYKKWQEMLEDDAMRRALETLPDDIYFDYYPDFSPTRYVDFQATTQADVAAVKAAVRRAWPGLIWKREWRDRTQWWVYTAESDDIALQIYAVKEAPPQCEPIYKEVEVMEDVGMPTEKRAVTRRVLVGWDCGKTREGE